MIAFRLLFGLNQSHFQLVFLRLASSVARFDGFSPLASMRKPPLNPFRIVGQTNQTFQVRSMTTPDAFLFSFWMCSQTPAIFTPFNPFGGSMILIIRLLLGFNLQGWSPHQALLPLGRSQPYLNSLTWLEESPCSLKASKLGLSIPSLLTTYGKVSNHRPMPYDILVTKTLNT